MGFPKSICTSINEVICHGISDSTQLREGDLVNLDVTAYLDGVHGDTNATFPVGRVDPETAALIERTRTAMERGIKAVRPGREVNVIGRVIEKYARRFQYGVVRDYTGHGVGEAFHSGLIIPHYDAAPAYSTVMEVGMVRFAAAVRSEQRHEAIGGEVHGDAVEDFLCADAESQIFDADLLHREPPKFPLLPKSSFMKRGTPIKRKSALF